MNNKLRIVLIAVLFVSGLSVMFYPIVSNYLNEQNQTKMIEDYVSKVDAMDSQKIAEEFAEAEAYNSRLVGLDSMKNPYSVTNKKAKKEYSELLNISGDIMAHIEIPACNIWLPVRHGIEDETLKDSAGHIQGSSLPIGGANTHSIISAHRGLPSARLFTDLDKLKIGDLFYIHILNRTNAYVVDEIRVLLPEEVKGLTVAEGEDYVTLLTCTPYSINTHRLLIRGTRIEYIPEVKQEIEREKANEKLEYILLYAVGIGVGLLILAIIWLVWKKSRRKA